MTKKVSVGCSGPITNTKNNDLEQTDVQNVENDLKEMDSSMIRVGKPAPDFTAAAFHNGEFTEVSLSDYKGKWVVLCFYPGDFTFV